VLHNIKLTSLSWKGLHRMVTLPRSTLSSKCFGIRRFYYK